MKNFHIKEIEELKSTILDYKQELKRVNSLNDNLLRISKEKANRDRDLRPKKAHSGFLILNRQSLSYKLHSNIKSSKRNQVNYIEFPCFKIKVQTPFNSSIRLDLIEKEMTSSFLKFAKSLGIEKWYEYDSIVYDTIFNIKDIIFNNDYNNLIFKHSFIANYKSNLWDIDIYTIKDVV